MNRTLIILTFAILSLNFAYSIFTNTQVNNINTISESYKANYNNSSLKPNFNELGSELYALNRAYIESDQLVYLDSAQHLIDDFVKDNAPQGDEPNQMVSFDTLASIFATVALIERANDRSTSSDSFTLETKGWLREYLNSTLVLRSQAPPHSEELHHLQSQGLLMELNHSVDFNEAQDLPNRKIAIRKHECINPEVCPSSIRL
ncbi:hypothetical protein GT360_18265 [Vibrio astriarenae]|uniref:Uncharacterized protein n=1 Tax=Vibrio astriarenae TaxID=1481923 RepID=A0A7Z2T6V8_9VIBR|nr:hypothetical protein [Vibrio astriarenae]QIA65484.1 hypothetical protein GT360_18265 [Vibrio astriarenae]